MKHLITASTRFGVGLFRQSVVLRYIFSGGTVAALELSISFLLVEFFKTFYLSATVASMTIGFVVRFLLQKYVTFSDKDESRATQQLVYYSILYIVSLGATTTLVYCFVEFLGFWYLLAQVSAIVIVAAGCFFVYKALIFTTK